MIFTMASILTYIRIPCMQKTRRNRAYAISNMQIAGDTHRIAITGKYLWKWAGTSFSNFKSCDAVPSRALQIYCWKFFRRVAIVAKVASCQVISDGYRPSTSEVIVNPVRVFCTVTRFHFDFVIHTYSLKKANVEIGKCSQVKQSGTTSRICNCSRTSLVR